jgi:phosphoglycolate phosphatase-like HAD superfamily hydrolase
MSSAIQKLKWNVSLEAKFLPSQSELLDRYKVGQAINLSGVIESVDEAKNAARLVPGLSITTVAVTYGATAAEVLQRENPDYLLDSITQILPLSVT